MVFLLLDESIDANIVVPPYPKGTFQNPEWMPETWIVLNFLYVNYVISYTYMPIMKFNV